MKGFTTFGNDDKGNHEVIGDDNLLYYYSLSEGGECFVGLDFGVSRVALSKFELYPRSEGVLDGTAFFGKKFQGSND